VETSMVMQSLKPESIILLHDLIVDNLHSERHRWYLAIHIDNKVANTYNTRVSLTGQDNLVDLNGTYKIAGNLDMNLDISRLNLKSIKVSHW
jgi:hypothetical protein